MCRSEFNLSIVLLSKGSLAYCFCSLHTCSLIPLIDRVCSPLGIYLLEVTHTFFTTAPYFSGMCPADELGESSSMANIRFDDVHTYLTCSLNFARSNHVSVEGFGIDEINFSIYYIATG